jgi:enterochelin esterase-like enzyme
MKKQNLLFLWAACCMLMIGLTGCQELNQFVDTAPGASESNSQTPTPFLPVLPTETPRPSVTPLPTQTATATFTPTAIPCAGEQGRVEIYTAVESGAPFDFRIYLPPCYDLLAENDYPVLYMIHGQTYNDDQWDRMGLDETAETMIHARDAAPFLIVMPLEVNTYANPYNNRFGTILSEQLVPWIDQNFRTCAERDCRAIGGLSRGGAWALHTGFDYWDVFGSIGAHSTPPFTGDDYWLPIWLGDIPPGQIPRLYLDAGDKDWFLQYTLAYLELLDRNEVPYEWNFNQGAHDEEYWSAHTGDYLRWYTQPWNERFDKLP